MRRKIQWPIFTLALLLIGMMAFLPACATTKRGKAQQAGRVLISMNRTVLDECTASKANADPETGEWKPLSKEVCRNAADAYRHAFATWENTLDLLDQDDNAKIGSKLAVILRYLLITADILAQVGVDLPPEVGDYMNLVREGIL